MVTGFRKSSCKCKLSHIFGWYLLLVLEGVEGEYYGRHAAQVTHCVLLLLVSNS